MQTQRQEWWFEEVDALVDRLIEDKAGLREQEEAWDFIGQGCGPEALATAKKMFAERSAPKPKEEPTEEPEAEPEPDVGDGGAALILSKKAPYDNAKVFVRQHCYKEGVLAVYWYDGSFWEWNGRCYQNMGMDDIERNVWDFLDEAKAGVINDSSRFKPTPNNVTDLIKGLKALLAVPYDAPRWLDGRPAGNLLVFKNGVVDIETGELMKPSPKLWIHHELDFRL